MDLFWDTGLLPGPFWAGHLFLATLGWLGFGRFITEAFRTTVPTVGDGYRAVQLLTLLIVLGVLYWFSRVISAEIPDQS